MADYSSHLTVLETSAALYSSSPLFKVPCIDQAGNVNVWNVITYEQFHHDVEHFARYWSRVLERDNVPRRSVIGLWIGGMTYTDVLHIYGISRAGYIPQLFSVRLPSPEVIFELLRKANAQALIFDPCFEAILADSPVPTHLAANARETDVAGWPELEKLSGCDGNDTAFVFHTSGSTSGSPKLVPCSYRWLDTIIKKANQTTQPKRPNQTDVTVWMGSMCHIGQTFMFLGSLQHGSCVIQPTKIAFSSEELMDLISRCGLNRLNQFATFLTTHLRNSRQNPKLLSMLANLDEILYSGLPLPREEEDWASLNGMNLKNLFGSTECGAMLLSIGGRDRYAALLRPLEGVSYGFVPITPASGSESGHQSNAGMLELVIFGDSGDCPDVSLRRADGHFHTGDLFQEVMPGSYVFRGRDDDWIKSENSLRCDTRAIEDNVRSTCAALVSECIVVGTGRPSPTLFVEPVVEMDHAKLKKDIIRRIRPFHIRRYMHERIVLTDMVVIVAPKTLPRTATKGNIRRQAVEETYKAQLDQIYGVIA